MADVLGWNMQRQPSSGSMAVWLQAFGASPGSSAALRQCGIAVLLLEAGMGGHVHTFEGGAGHDVCRLAAGCINAVVLVRGALANTLARTLCSSSMIVLVAWHVHAMTERPPACTTMRVLSSGLLVVLT